MKHALILYSIMLFFFFWSQAESLKYKNVRHIHLLLCDNSCCYDFVSSPFSGKVVLVRHQERTTWLFCHRRQFEKPSYCSLEM